MSDTLERFVRWFVVPFHTLRAIPHGDAAFAAMAIGFALCERHHRIKTDTRDKFWDKDDFLHDAAQYLNVEHGFFLDFWDVFRNGLQHQGSPKWRKGCDGVKPYKWAIHGDFPMKPILALNAANEEIICIDPWKFTEHYINLFLADPPSLDDAVHHTFGTISQIDILHSLQELHYTGRLVPDTSKARTCNTTATPNASSIL